MQEVEPTSARRREVTVDAAAPALLAVLCTAAYATLSLRRFARFDTPSWDNAIFEQAISAYAHLQAPIVDIKGPGYNILGDHFSPITALVAPFYRVFPGGGTLLVAQAVLVGLSVWVIARGAVRALGLASGMAVAVAYGLSFGIASAVWVDFHEVAFGVLFLALSSIAYVERRWRACALWALPLLLVKEDLGITVAAVGVALALAGARRTGLWTTLAGVVGFALTLFVIIPAFNASGGYDYVDVVGAGGSGPGPWTILMTDPGTKTVTLLLTFGVTGFLALRSWWALVAVPTLLWRFVGDNPYYWGTDWHYGLVLMPVVFAALLDAAVRLREAGAPDWLRRYATHVPAIAAAVALVLLAQFPLARLFEAQTWQPSPRAAAAREALEVVPYGAKVETDIGLITHLVTDRTVYWTGTIGDVVPDWMVLDAQTGWGGTAPDAAAYGEQQHPGTSWRVVMSRDGYQVARRVG